MEKKMIEILFFKIDRVIQKLQLLKLWYPNLAPNKLRTGPPTDRSLSKHVNGL